MRSLPLLLLALGAAPGVTLAQTAGIGTVTGLTGRATVERREGAAPAPLHSRDAVHAGDRIATGEASLVRILLGVTTILTLRERSVATLDATATTALAEGVIALNLGPEALNPGQRTYVVTANAVARLRGGLMVAEVAQQGSCEADPDGVVSRFTSLRGAVVVSPRDAATGIAGTTVVTLQPLETLAISRCTPPVAPTPVAREDADALTATFRLPSRGSVPQPARPLPRLHP